VQAGGTAGVEGRSCVAKDGERSPAARVDAPETVADKPINRRNAEKAKPVGPSTEPRDARDRLGRVPLLGCGFRSLRGNW